MFEKPLETLSPIKLERGPKRKVPPIIRGPPFLITCATSEGTEPSHVSLYTLGIPKLTDVKTKQGLY
jgi:hypothetical protein